MSTMNLNGRLTFPGVSRRVLRNVSLIILIPSLFLIGSLFFARDGSRNEDMQIAALVLAEDMHSVLLQNGWSINRVFVNDKQQVELDIDLAYSYQAEFIKSRNGRVQFSYVKLACPPPEAKVYSILPKFESVWVHLLYNKELIVKGACPKSSLPFK